MPSGIKDTVWTISHTLRNHVECGVRVFCSKDLIRRRLAFMTVRPRRRRVVFASCLFYGLLLGASFIVRHSETPPMHVDPFERAAVVRAVDGDRVTSDRFEIAYREYASDFGRDLETIVLLHGSPGRKEDFGRLAPVLARSARVVVPDLPGFGSSTRTVPDYSFRAHAAYVRQLLDQLGIQRAHLLGLSMGGGVALNLIEMAPERVASLTMLSAIGIQEMELTGDYYVNHVVHGAQLGALWLAREGTPHMGLLDNAPLGISYARNFFDSDQRALRPILQRVTVPTLIVHGADDKLVPIEAAEEHYRLVPQSELIRLSGDHFLVFMRAPEVGDVVGAFVRRAADGRASTRADADPERVRLATLPFNSMRVPRARGIAAAVFAGLLTTGAVISESVTSVAAGLLVARRRVSLVTAIFGCFIGMFIANLLLYVCGRYYGRRVIEVAPTRWLMRSDAFERSLARLSRGGIAWLLRDWLGINGRRTTSLAAGVVKVRLLPAVSSLFLTTAVLASALVGLSTILCSLLLRVGTLASLPPHLRTASTVAIVATAVRVVLSTASARQRRLMVSLWRRWTRWEFWPPWVFYPPVVVYLAWLMARYRSVTLFTAANPAILAGGFVGESKYDILQGLAGTSEYVAHAFLIEARLGVAERVLAARRFMADQGLTFPIVLKPNHGQRGSGVVVVRSADELNSCLEKSSVDTIIQEHVAGAEFGVFYVRHPSEAHGHIFSITEKRFPTVAGDGRCTLEELILQDDRAVCVARVYCERHRERLWTVPAAGETIPLAELGTHCRGAMFLDGGWVLTPLLEQRFDNIARAFNGFYFGRFDVRADAGIEAFQTGQGFKIIEVNGVTSEATHIYHPGTPLMAAYRVLFRQWRLAFDIGAENHRRGVTPTSVRTLFQLTREYVRTSRHHLRERPDQVAATSGLRTSHL
jgi:pimeloyl-ACP methyl ester carboxylesterase/membrane protein DedA with SNARE-associated domain